MSAAVLLIDPKYPHNVGNIVRACAAWNAPQLRWTGRRVTDKIGQRLPREERLAAYKERVTFQPLGIHLTGVPAGPDPGRPIDHYVRWGMTPVCVERLDTAESLDQFVHPERAVYVFGPEDSGVPKGVRNACHSFVRIPSEVTLNLAAAVNIVLWDRQFKQRMVSYARSAG